MLAVAIGRDPRASSKKEFFELSMRAAEQGEPFALLNVGYAYNNTRGQLNLATPSEVIE
jgi:hypothetical protein